MFRGWYDLFLGGYFDKPLGLHPYADALRQRLGDVYEMPLPKGAPLVVLNDPEDFMAVLRAEWHAPAGSATTSWPLVAYYKSRGYNITSPDYDQVSPREGSRTKEAPFAMVPGDERWRTGRLALQPEMFRAETVEALVPKLHEVALDLVAGIREGSAPRGLADLTVATAFEMISVVLVGKRMGLLRGQASEGTKRLTGSAARAFALMGELQLLSLDKGLQDARWPLFLSEWDTVVSEGARILEEAHAQGYDGVLPRVTGAGNLSRERAVTELAGLLGAGVDTTSSVLQNLLYALARYPHTQARLRAQIERVSPDGELSGARLKQCHYLRALNREQHRRHHTAAGNMRVEPFAVKLAGGYEIPQGRCIVFNQTAYGFDEVLLRGDPYLFLPERWLDPHGVFSRSTAAPDNALLGFVEDYVDLNQSPEARKVEVRAPSERLRHPLMETPFGVGPRQCIGARIATAEIHTAVAELVRHFELGPVSKNTDFKQMLLRVPFPDPEIEFVPIGARIEVAD